MFFGMIRSAGGCNDHPNVPTFLQLYKILSLFGILRPPKKGNCTYVEGDHCNKRIIKMVDLKQIYKAPTEDLLSKLIETLDIVVNDEGWQMQEIDFENIKSNDVNVSKATVVENIIYYMSGTVFLL